jgi:hypothetical protein
MSYICQKCGKQQPKGQPAIREVVETRPIVHPPRYRGNECIDKGGKGTAIVRERIVGPCCA